jgi:hypothetical protein
MIPLPSPSYQGGGRGFVDIRKDLLLFCLPSQYGNNCLLFRFMFKINLSDSILVSITKNSGIYTKFTTPRKQQTKVGLQKSTENAAEAICCPESEFLNF